MKEEYSAPTMTFELLEKADVLESSGGESQGQSTLSAAEKENFYMDALTFFKDWFFD